ncbi:MAG: type VI secretion system baseplate subunit TssE [Thermodesulfobacteriota bacterium]|nr:type VI secretion system baseplate subunit TssE [Thermodesulfobacteriota bacterium]
MKNRLNVQASILDRLIDQEPDVSAEPAPEFSVGQIKDTVARDLENLLNTRRTIIPVSSSYREVSDSLVLYGLPDFTSSNPANVSVRSKLRLEIEKTITRFEPRLKNVAVHIDSPAGTGRDLRFRINAVLVVDPIVEPVVFDTRYDLHRSKYSILK